MSRSRTATTLVVGMLLAIASAGSGSASADARISSYCHPTGDFCQGIFRKTSGGIDFKLNTFSFRGTVQICVTKRTRICHGRRLKPIGDGLYEASARWERNWPNQGHGRYAVSWYQGGSKIGHTLHFRH
jgi:hypothetical protein